MNPQIPEPTQSPTLSPEPIKQVERDSHVTSTPNAADGHNYDPQLRVQLSNEPGVVHATRPIEPQAMEISDELLARHEEAKKRHPDLNLSKGEYVLTKLHRHPIGLFAPVAITAFLMSLLVAFWIMYPVILAESSSSDMPTTATISMIIVPLLLLVGIFGYIAVWVYMRNTFYLTNESVIQEIQHSLFSKHEQTVSLGSIEDVSFRQTGILQTMLNYGTIRLSTEGEETTYRFHYVASPKNQVAMLNNAVESFKNGRPVTGE
ncbi:PH domain-containing protein [Candidatus Saccharibacteria bacterium]|nr:PH domain-containing protein [Candidatus Saccharibacteria bacterium]MBH2007478.1 PH domain-containing protein [Candidatus Saccharibacteria bacterium]